jgi:hypothetical protein
MRVSYNALAILAIIATGCLIVITIAVGHLAWGWL